MSGGSTVSHVPGMATGHRGWNGQPDGAAMTLGGSPVTTGRIRVRLAGSGSGTAARSARVYGCSGPSMRGRAPASSTIRPRYMTATRSSELPRTGQVVGDVQIADAACFTESAEQPQDLGPAGSIDHGHRFVSDDEHWLQDHGPRDVDPLSLAARERVRVASEEVRGRPEPNLLQRVDHPVSPLRRRARCPGRRAARPPGRAPACRD